MQGLRTQRYKLDIDDLVESSFLTTTNTNRIIAGMNASGNTPLSPAIGGLGNTGSAFSNNQLPVWNTAAGKFIPTGVPLPGATQINYLPVPILIHGSSDAIAVPVTFSGGSPTAAAVAVAIVTADASVQVGPPTIRSGIVSSVFILSGGSGYSSVPTVTIAPPLYTGSSTVTATATATVVSGVVTVISMGTAGAGYCSYLSPVSGSTAAYGWQTFTLANIATAGLGNLAGASAVMLYSEINLQDNTSNEPYATVQIRKNATSAERNAVSAVATGSGKNNKNGNTGLYPVDSGGSFQHQILATVDIASADAVGDSIWIIGYTLG